MKVYHSRFKNSNQIYYAATAVACCLALLYLCARWFGEPVRWHHYLLFGCICINSYIPVLMRNRERAELDEATGELRVRPGKRRLLVAEIRAVEVVKSGKGRYKYITLRVGQYDFQRLYTADYHGLITDLQQLNPAITVDLNS